jgi:glycosyltransferase involved in cell wall biosynthesis
MRILIATHHRALVGGIETYLREAIPALRGRGHEVALAFETPAAAGQDAIDEGLAWWTGDELCLRRIRDWRPDVVFGHGVAGVKLEEALLDVAPAVLFAHGYHGTCVSGTKRHAWPRVSVCQRQLGAGCLLCYLPRRCGGLNPLTLVQQYRLQTRRHALLRHYAGIVVASRHMRDEYLRHGLAKACVHLNPLFPPGEEPDAEPPGERTPTKRVLLVGRLTELKGGLWLVRALREASDRLGRPLTLVVAGDGPERSMLEARAADLGIAAEFHGWVDASRRRALMRGADVLAVPSLWPEPFGLVGLEAGCVGLPAVGFSLGGIPDWLCPGTSGELAPGNPPRVSELAAALVRALSDAEHLQRLRAGAWRMAAQFTLTAHIDRLEGILHAVATGRHTAVAAEARD